MIKQTKDGLLLNLKIIPNASKNEIAISDDIVKVKIIAQPIDGKANKALVEFLAKELKVPKTSISIVKGISSKEKTLLFKSLTDEKVKFFKEKFEK